MQIKDQEKNAICIQEGLAGSTKDWNCFAAYYDSTQTPKIVQRFTDTIDGGTSYDEAIAT
jgi:hypothetical protein